VSIRGSNLLLLPLTTLVTVSYTFIRARSASCSVKS